MYKQDLALDNQQWLVCHQTKPFIAITSIFTLYQSVSTCWVHIYGSNRFIQKVFVLDMNYEYFISYNCAKKRLKNYTSVNINVQCTQFLNLQV